MIQLTLTTIVTLLIMTIVSATVGKNDDQLIVCDGDNCSIDWESDTAQIAEKGRRKAKHRLSMWAIFPLKL